MGEAKERHELRRYRYVGWMRYQLQAYLAAMVLNLNRPVKLVTNGPSRVRVVAVA